MIATYRLQLRSGLTLDRVRTEWLDPLADLGVSHLYLSPIFRATEGSTHGYDVVDPDVIDEAVGDEAALGALADAAHERGMGIVLDLVPNHMATDHDRNARWWDLLRNGPASSGAGWFDLDWDVPERRLRGRLLLPVLPDHYGRELERGAFRVEIGHVHGPELVLVHPSTTAPLELGSLAPLLRSTGEANLLSLATEIDTLPGWSLPHDPDDLDRRRHHEPILRTALARLLDRPEIVAAVDRALDALNADVESLDSLIEAQPYRPARWQTSLEDLSYRRFFDINTLVGVRVDRADVFEQTHRAVRRWVEAGWVDGLRVDHVDGLRDPAGYLERLRALAPAAWIVVEKIVEGDETLPPWPVEGTTGYEVAELIDRLDLDDEGRPVLERIASGLAPDGPSLTDVGAVVLQAKLDVLDELLSADLNRLTESLMRACEHRRRFRDVTRRELHECLRAVLARLDVYRTYVRAGHATSTADAAVVGAVLAEVAEEFPELDPEIVELLSILLPGAGIDTAGEWDFVLRFQQLSGPTMAKGAEDTAWFRLLTLVSRCEVGADPDAWGLPLEAFHDAMAERQERWPRALTAGTTHDSKRSADVRARLVLLSQDAEGWAALVDDWSAAVADATPGVPIDAASSYQMLQTIVGAWPIDEARLVEHTLKAAREAKVHTSWLRPDAEFEAALAAHAGAVLACEPAMDVVRTWLDDHDQAWSTTVLAHRLVALTVPGVPDLYQGSEDLLVRLTDPDNRHPVDPGDLARRLAGPDASRTTTLVRTVLRCRREHTAAFGPRSTYEPLWAAGPRADHAVAFARGDGGPEVVIVAPRKVMGLADDGWRGTTITLPEGSWRNLVTEGDQRWEATVDLDELLSSWPVALLAADPVFS